LLFCDRVLEQPGLASDPRFASNAARSAARAELHAIITAAFATLNAEQVMARLDAAQIASAVVNTMAEVWVHPQLRARERWAEVATSSGPVPALLPPGLTNDEARMDAVPALGQHSNALLAELGFTADEIAGLCAEGAIEDGRR
jgi:itaconate CoA-transferase